MVPGLATLELTVGTKESYLTIENNIPALIPDSGSIDDLALAILLGMHAQQHGFAAAKEFAMVGTNCVDATCRARYEAALDKAASIIHAENGREYKVAEISHELT